MWQGLGRSGPYGYVGLPKESAAVGELFGEGGVERPLMTRTSSCSCPASSSTPACALDEAAGFTPADGYMEHFSAQHEDGQRR